MLDIKFIRENTDTVKKNNRNRGVDVDVDQLIDLDEKRRSHIAKLDEMRALRNKTSKGKPSDEDIVRMREVGEHIIELEHDLGATEAQTKELLLKIPNLTHPDVPIGSEDDYKVLAIEGKETKFDFAPKDHEQLLLELDLIDFKRGTKVAAAKFYFAKNNLVRLSRALIQYGIDIVTKHGFTLLETPDMARNEILSGIGFNPRGPESQVYSIENSDLSLIGTAEITVGGYHANEILDFSAGPKKYVALSHCFRTEVGAAGRTSKGLYRVHQFTKLEMFVFCKPEDSEKMHDELLNIEKEIVNGLDIPYRVIDVASGDLGGPAYRKFDIEAWMTMKSDQGGYGEITSTSNCTDYQARRLNIRYKTEEGVNNFAHTLNGTAIVSSRFPIAILENYQTKEGTIKIPKVLQSYMGGLKEIK
ncbi:MAG: serine--tRNA ligase [Patescibacteria group bacterium]